LASTLTAVSMALGVAAMIAVIVVHGVFDRLLNQAPEGFHLVIGAKGGEEQLIFNSLFHLSKPVENIPYGFYEDFVSGRFKNYTDTAVPICLGDSFSVGERRFRVVGTLPEFFDKLGYGLDENGEPQLYEFRAGRNIKRENHREAVLGSVVAYHSGLGVGDRIRPSHGLTDTTVKEHEFEDESVFEIVGILEPTGTTSDRAVFTNLEGFLRIREHVPDEAQVEGWLRKLDADRGQDGAGSATADAPTTRRVEETWEVTAILVRCGGPFDPEGNIAMLTLPNLINEGMIAQAVSPIAVTSRFVDQLIAPLHFVLLVLTILIIIVASVGVLVSIYNSMNERSHDIAVMRALGANRIAVLLIVLVESILLSLLGGVVGVVLGHGLIAAASPFLEAWTGLSIDFFQFDRVELAVIPSLVVLASLVGLLPAIAAYRTDVAKALSGGR
jgi:putative ABC transport system permease protein